MKRTSRSFTVGGQYFLPNRWDILIIPVFFILAGVLYTAIYHMDAPIAVLQHSKISLAPDMLPGYAARTTLRLFLALIPSTICTLIFATLAAKNRYAEQIIIPMVDILQSVPVLGYISFTLIMFLALFPNSVLGLECAAIFAVFTAQVWNMLFSLYQSLKTVPHDLHEAATAFGLTPWQRFWRLELPYAMPGLLWNTMMSVSASWFFIVAQEAISVGNINYSLPGIGSYLALAITKHDFTALGYSIGAMFTVILIYDQLLFRPLIAWADKFKVELTASQDAPTSWFLELLKRTQLLGHIRDIIGRAANFLSSLPIGKPGQLTQSSTQKRNLLFDIIWYTGITLVGIYGAYRLFFFINHTVGWGQVGKVFLLGSYTALRVFALLALSVIIWVPIGVNIGLRPKLVRFFQPSAQFLAAFPANMIYPVAVFLIIHYDLNPNIWVTVVMMIGAQWYILFNVIAGASVIPTDMKEAMATLHIKGWLKWKRVLLPAIFPFLITGVLTAWGGAWNASIVAEVMQWGSERITASGLGAYITLNTDSGNIARVAIGVGAMALFVVVVNRFVWRRLYRIAEKKIRYD